MTKTVRIIVIAALGLALLLLLSLYRTLLDGVPYYVSFDRIARIIVNESWRVLSAPTVFLTAIFALVIFIYRRQFRPLLLAVREITVGGLSAKFDPQRLEPVATAPLENPIVPSISTDAKRAIIANFSEGLCLYLLQVANRPIDLMEHFRLISRDFFKRDPAFVGELDKAQEPKAYPNAVYRTVLATEASGFLRALYQFPGLVATFKFETTGGSRPNLVAKIDADVLDLLRKRIGKEP